MGGEDWKLWMQALKDADVLSEDASTVAYSYIGSELTYPSILKERSVRQRNICIRQQMRLRKEVGVKALISVNKGLVTQASAAIPIVPLYMSVLYKVMKEIMSMKDVLNRLNVCLKKRDY